MKTTEAKDLRFKIAKTITQRIASGKYKEGEFIPYSTNLVKELGASRTSIREALVLLVSKGVLQSIPGTGTKVLSFASWNLFDFDLLNWLSGSALWRKKIPEYIIELRFVIEPESTKLAVKNATAQNLLDIENSLQHMKKNLNSIKEYTRADAEFHKNIILATGNPLLINMAKVISHPVSDLIFISNKRTSKITLESSFQLHEKLYEAILNRKVDAALDLNFILLELIKEVKNIDK